jgi:acetate---CoA ligase (ADP-forming)
MLKPKTIAIAGLSDTSPFSRYVQPTLESGAQVIFINPNHPTVLGQPTVASLSAVEGPVDLVASFMSAERTTALVEEAAAHGVGGLVLVAAMFAESGADGAALQERIAEAAITSGMAVMGPNGLGYVNVRRGINLTIAGLHQRRPGGISVVSQSGAMLTGIAMAAWSYEGCGINMSISAGNEAVTDLTDYLDYLVDDPDTRSVGLVIETIRRPKEFFAAVERAVEAGKPIVALKLGRSERTQKMALSHTASVAGNAWDYDVALRQAGIALAHDPEELVDRLALFEQIPRRRWSAVQRLGVLTRTGGFASLSFDVAQEEGVHLPTLDSFGEWASTTLQGVTVPNPLDATSQGIPIWKEITAKYAGTDELDAVMLVHPVGDRDDPGAKPAVEDFADAARGVSKPCILANCSGVPAAWVRSLTGDTVACGRGVRGSLRGLQTLGAFVRHREQRSGVELVNAQVPPPVVEPIGTPEGLLMPFDATFGLLASAGIPMAPYHMVPPEAAATALEPGFSGPYAAKLANVAHRSEYGAVRLGVRRQELGVVIGELREIARDAGLPQQVVVQPSVDVVGETFVGIHGESDLGPIVLFGLGGIFVEALNRVGGRMAPFSEVEARGLIEEFADLGLMHGGRGRKPWDLEALTRVLVACGALADGARDWIASLDINPLTYGPNGYLAVDAVLLMRGSDDVGRTGAEGRPPERSSTQIRS